jgi:hypothetical protein
MNALFVRSTVAALILTAGATAARAKEPGTWWEITAESRTKGGPAPQTEKECLPVSLGATPPMRGKDCQVSEVRRSGGRMTWKMVCQGAPGDGELVLSSDAFTMNVTYRTPQGEARWVSRGKKLGGACDAAEKDRLEAALAAYRQRGLHGEEQICGAAIQELDPAPFSADALICKDPQQKADFCEAVRSRDGLVALSAPGRDAPRKAGLALCGEDEARLRARHCGDAMKLKDDQDAIFAVAVCPDAAALAKKECRGDDPSRAAKRYRDLCEAWQNRLAEQEPQK